MLVWLSACASTTPRAPEAVPVQRMAEASEPEPEPIVVEPAMSSTYDTVAVMPGFVPDPMVVEGRSGGPQDATSRDVACVGFIAHSPSHLLQLGADFGSLRVLVKSDGDTTLVIRTPDERMLCNDDFEGLNPGVVGVFPAGNYEVWVGSYERGTEYPYRLGVSELTSVTPASL